MYTLEDRMRAVNLYLKYGCSPAAVRRELGYPTKNTVKAWAREFKATGALRGRCRPRPPRYSLEQKQAAVDYYLEHGRNMSGTARAMGYPHKATLKEWLDEALPDRRGLHSKRKLKPKIEFTTEQKREAVVDLGSRDGPAREVAEKYGVTPTTLYQWKYRLLGKEPPLKERKRKDSPLSDDNAACEGFFGRVKNELFYGRSWAGVSVEEFMGRLDGYLHWYNEKRIKISLGRKSPMEYRQALGYA